jgi:hypothetical protein
MRQARASAVVSRLSMGVLLLEDHYPTAIVATQQWIFSGTSQLTDSRPG